MRGIFIPEFSTLSIKPSLSIHHLPVLYSITDLQHIVITILTQEIISLIFIFMGSISVKKIEYNVNVGKKRELIVDVAVQLILSKGVESFSMRDLAKKSGLSIGLIYHYFSDKQEIIQAALQTHIHDCTKQIVSEIKTIKDNRKKLQKKITDTSYIYQKYPTLFKILINFISWSMYNSNSQILLSDMFVEMRTYLSSLIEVNLSPGSLERKEIENLAYLILGSAIGISIQMCVDTNKINTSKDISNQLSEVIFHYLDNRGI